jgi:hypothetical protein
MLDSMVARPFVPSPGRRCPPKNGPMMSTTAIVAARYLVLKSCTGCYNISNDIDDYKFPKGLGVERLHSFVAARYLVQVLHTTSQEYIF